VTPGAAARVAESSALGLRNAEVRMTGRSMLILIQRRVVLLMMGQVRSVKNAVHRGQM
jgi:hypothetical protein